MKLHFPVAHIIVQALSQTFGQSLYTDKVIERLFKSNRKLGARDRRFVAETIYEIVRWWRFLWATLDPAESSSSHSDSHSERDLWKLLGAYLLLQGSQDRALPTWEEFKGLDPEKIRRNAQAARLVPPLRESVPDWLYAQGCEELGEAVWGEWLAALNRPAPVVLRANRLKTTREALARRLADEGIATDPAPRAADGLILRERRNVFTSAAFASGLFEIQDGASQQVAPLLAVTPGMRVIDACAGGGGKTLHLASLMGNKGKIISMDIHEKKLVELKKRAARGGVDIVETKLIEGTKTIKRLEKSADRLLLDVPCSGLGVLRRNPDAKWKLNPEKMAHLRNLQAEILSSYSSIAKPGGRMIYATCSCLPSENERQIEIFLKEHGTSWTLIEEKKFAPGQDGYDGFYAAALERVR